MRDERLHTVAAAGLAIGALLGMAGSFAPSAELRGLAWGIDGIALVRCSASITCVAVMCTWPQGSWYSSRARR
jgi:hypothetical protein